MIKNLLLGARCFLNGFSLIRKPGLRRYAIIPLLINIIVFTGLVLLVKDQAATLLQGLLPGGQAWWIGIIKSLVWLLVGAALAVLIFFSFTIIANLIGAPFNGPLAEAVEKHLLGVESQQSNTLTQIFKEIPATVGSELHKFLYFALWMIPALLLFLIPGVNLVAPFVWGLLGAWMLALEYLDYPMSNHQHRFSDVRRRLRQHRSIGLGFGGMVVLAICIPIVNLIVMPAAVAGATQMWVEYFKHNVKDGL
ncbi:sulfate transporter CysZ [Pseudomonadota bacterium]